MLINELADYLKHDENMFNVFYLNKHQTVFLHWADWDLGCEMKRPYQGSQFKSAIYDLKESAPDAGKEFDINSQSFYNHYYNMIKSGAHRPVPEWFNHHDYMMTLYDGILNKSLPRRKLRLRFFCPVKIRYKTSTIEEANIYIHQLTGKGLLISMAWRIAEKVKSSEWVELKFSSDFLKAFLDNSGAQLFEAINGLERYPLKGYSVGESIYFAGKYLDYCPPRFDQSDQSYFFLPFDCIQYDEFMFPHKIDNKMAQQFLDYLSCSLKKGLFSYI